MEVFTGEICRPILSPEKLNYGERIIQLSQGDEIQSLTPSFIGDGPELWQISPTLPSGLIINLDSGVISGIPNQTSSITKFTITASNVAGSSNTILYIEIFTYKIRKIRISQWKFLLVQLFHSAIYLALLLSEFQIHGP